MDAGRLHILAFLHPVNKELEDLDIVHWIDDLAQYPNLLELLIGEEQLLFPVPTSYVDGRKEPSIGNAPIQIDFHIPVPLNSSK
jgi:hypothetical protein